MQSCVARQPIFDRSKAVYGYELLFRAGTENVFNSPAGGAGGDLASARVLTDAMHLNDLATLTGGGKCFINITPTILFEELYTALPKDQVVLELLETIEPDKQILEACLKCRRAGYVLALDDYVLEGRFEPLLPLIDVLKVDFSGTTAAQRREVITISHSHRCKLLAEKVETHEDFQIAHDLGYDFFQGYFFCKPEMITRRDVPVSQVGRIQFFHEIARPTLDLDKLDGIISRDVGLSYKLLRYLNSGAFRFRYTITSIRHALSLIGDRPLRKWASLVLMSILGEGKPPELLKVCMVRARLCENLANRCEMADRASELFMAGMFSVLDAMLDLPMDALLEEISPPAEVKETLRGEQTKLRPVLDVAIALETGYWEPLVAALKTLGVEESAVGEDYRDALDWAAQQCRELNIAARPKRGAA